MATSTRPNNTAAKKSAAVAAVKATAAKKTAPKKAPAKAAPAPKAAPATVPNTAGWYPPKASAPGTLRYWTEDGWIGRPQTAAAIAEAVEDDQPLAVIAFEGRELTVRRPAPEQLGVWSRTAGRLNKVRDAAGAMTKEQQGQEAAKLLGLAIKIIESVLVEEADKEWLEDRMLAGGKGGLKLERASDIITLTVTEFNQTRAAAPTTGPVPKARRR